MIPRQSSFRDLDELFQELQQSAFRRSRRLGPRERAYLTAKTLPVIMAHARDFVIERLAPARPKNEGRQTPLHGHPVFVAQHATATCCRHCLWRWHWIPMGKPLSDEQVAYVLRVIERWLTEHGDEG
jgi:dTDP-4-amino-4,6-dideoxygalactose transaminase